MVMNIRVLTPDRVICSTTADEVVLPGLTGQVGVLDGHAALITALDTGLLRIKLEDKWTPIILCGGLAEIDHQKTELEFRIGFGQAFYRLWSDFGVVSGGQNGPKAPQNRKKGCHFRKTFLGR